MTACQESCPGVVNCSVFAKTKGDNVSYRKSLCTSSKHRHTADFSDTNRVFWKIRWRSWFVLLD